MTRTDVVLNEWVDNELDREPSGVYRLRGHTAFSYSDGADAEQYLHRAFDSCSDLSSSSLELENWIKDWRSEYHLSHKRANLLNCFEFEKAANVLEVGSGCGAISRYLGETFNLVVSIEGSLARAELAKKRCRDLSNVCVISSPFQNINFKRKFDIIFCIGVLEYSNKFVQSANPYQEIVQYFSKHLTDVGVLVVAIENRFGLKYFNSAAEDHTGRKFDGIEDYPANAEMARTFGYCELKNLLLRGFEAVKFHFPFPDYKVPDAVFSEELLNEANIANILGKFRSRDYSRPIRPLFSERRAWQPISANNLVPIFSNSFLVIAEKGSNELVGMNGLGVVRNTDRLPQFHTTARLYLDDASRRLRVHKEPVREGVESEMIELRAYDELWRQGRTLHSIILARISSIKDDLGEIFRPAKKWYSLITALGGEREKIASTLERNALAQHFDAIWQNTIVDDDELHFIDQEWVLHAEISPKQILVRSIYTFIASIRGLTFISSSIRYSTGATLIKSIADGFGESITREEFVWLVQTESSVYATVTGKSRSYHKLGILATLYLPLAFAGHLAKIATLGEYLEFVRRMTSRVISVLLSKLKNRLAR